MKKQKTLNRFAAVAAVLLTLCLVFAAPVSAEAVDITPGQNVENAVEWALSGDKYSLEIKQSGEYNLTKGFTASTIRITSSNVALNGNNHLISVSGNIGKIVVGKDSTGKVLDISNVELININLKSTAHPKATADGLIEIYGQTTVRGCTIDSSECVDIGSAVLASIWVTGDSAVNTKILGNTIKLPSKEGDGAKNVIAGIRINSVYGHCTVNDNEFVLGKSSGIATTPSNVYAVQIQNAKDTSIVEFSGNSIYATQSLVKNKGVAITAANATTPTIKITENKFYVKDSADKYDGILEMVISTYNVDEPVATINIELKDNEVVAPVESLMIVSGNLAQKPLAYTLKGVVENNKVQSIISSLTTPDASEYTGVGIITDNLKFVTTINVPEKVGFDSVKVGYTQPEAKTVSITNNGYIPVVLGEPTATSSNYIISKLSKTTLFPGDEATFTVQPIGGLAVGNYADTIKVTTDVEGLTEEIAVSFLVYQPSSGGSSKPVEEPEEPVVEPEVPTEEPEAGEATVETEVTDGGEVELETPAAGGSAAADEDEAKITGVVLPTGTDSEVTFVPVSEQAAPEGKETQTKKVFEINVPTYEKGKAAVIKFTMTVAELAADGKEAADVALWHFDEETGEWTKLVTSYTIVDGVVYFEAITNDFSPFAIVYEDEPVDEPVEEPETPASPAPVLGLIAALGAAVVLRRK